MRESYIRKLWKFFMKTLRKLMKKLRGELSNLKTNETIMVSSQIGLLDITHFAGKVNDVTFSLKAVTEVIEKDISKIEEREEKEYEVTQKRLKEAEEAFAKLEKFIDEEMEALMDEIKKKNQQESDMHPNTTYGNNKLQENNEYIPRFITASKKLHQIILTALNKITAEVHKRGGYKNESLMNEFKKFTYLIENFDKIGDGFMNLMIENGIDFDELDDPINAVLHYESKMNDLNLFNEAKEKANKKACDHTWVNRVRMKNPPKVQCSKCGAWKWTDGRITSDEDGKVLLTEAVETLDYNVDMTEAQAKKTLASLSQQLINDWEKDKDKKMTQYTANIYANIITKNLLPRWTKGFKKLSITLDSYQSFNTLEFITPAMTQDFVSRFINGRETLNGFVHRSPDIRIKISPRIFHTMKDPNDAYNFFKAAVQYYDSKIERYGHAIMKEVMRLGHNMKHLIGNSKLSGIVTYPLALVFVFDDVNMTDKETFKIKQDEIDTINKFVRNIMTRYAAPEKEKKQIVDDVKEMVKALREAVELNETGKVKPLTETVQHVRELYYLPEALEQLFSGGFTELIKEASYLFIEEQIDHDFRPDPKLKEIYEAAKVKKLKKIPNDLVAYISIETEAIRDANDKMMIASYCLGKLEIVEWYIELLEVGSNRYVVPHSLPYLEGLRTQLLACFKKIMDVKITNPQDRPIIDIQYPKNYEG